MILNKNVKDIEKEDIIALWDIRAQQQYERYLGLPPLDNLEQ